MAREARYAPKIHPAGVLLKDLFISPFFIDNCE